MFPLLKAPDIDTHILESSDSGLKKERGLSLTFSVNTDTQGANEGSNLSFMAVTFTVQRP